MVYLFMSAVFAARTLSSFSSFLSHILIYLPEGLYLETHKSEAWKSSYPGECRRSRNADGQVWSLGAGKIWQPSTASSSHNAAALNCPALCQGRTLLLLPLFQLLLGRWQSGSDGVSKHLMVRAPGRLEMSGSLATLAKQRNSLAAK